MYKIYLNNTLNHLLQVNKNKNKTKQQPRNQNNTTKKQQEPTTKKQTNQLSAMTAYNAVRQQTYQL